MQHDVTSLRNRRADQRWNRVCIGDIFERLACSEDERTVLTGDDGAYENPDHKNLSASKADQLANQFANAVLSSGIKAGSIVMMFCENSVEIMIAKVGLAKIGVTVAPVNPHLSIDVIESLLDLCNPAAAIVDTDFYAKVSPCLEQRGIGILANIHIQTPLAVGQKSFSDFIASQDKSEPQVTVHGDDIWQILFTSGSTATPKGVMLSHSSTTIAALSLCATMARGLETEQDTVLGYFLPVAYHVGDTLIYTALLSRARAVIGRRFDAGKLARAIDREKVTAIWAGSPHSLKNLIDEFEKDPSLSGNSIHNVLFGWAPMANELYVKAKEVFNPKAHFLETFAMTEIVAGHTFSLYKNTELFQRTTPRSNYVGVANPIMGTFIMDSNGNKVGAHQKDVGEVVYRSPVLMAGYYRQPEATQAALEGGWFRGGDACQWGENLQKILVDRFKDVIKTGGENVSSIRVEAVMMQHPAIDKAAVIGVQDARWGEAVTGMAVLRSNQTVTEKDLIAFCKTHLAAFEVPKRVVFLDALPESLGGKVQKHKLRVLMQAAG